MRKIGSFRNADLGIRSDQRLFRRPNVRAPFEQCRWQASGDLGRELLLRQASSTNHFAWILAKQESDPVLRLLDLLLKSRDRFRGGLHQLLALPQIKQGGDAAALAIPDKLERRLTRA